MRSIGVEAAGKLLGTILESIAYDGERGKLSSKPGTHPSRKVSLPAVEGADNLPTEDLCNLVAARLDLAGYIVFHDPKKAQQQIDEALARVKIAGLDIQKN